MSTLPCIVYNISGWAGSEPWADVQVATRETMGALPLQAEGTTVIIIIAVAIL